MRMFAPVVAATTQVPIDRWTSWSDVLSALTGEGVGLTLGAGLGIIGRLLMAVTHFIWQVLKGAFAFAYTDFVTPLTDFIDHGFSAVYQAVVYDTPLFGIAIVVGVVSISIVLFRRGISGGFFQQALMVALPLAVLLALGQAAMSGGGSVLPSKLVRSGVDFADKLTLTQPSLSWANEGLAEAANELEGLDTASSSPTGGYTCQTYIENLYAETDAPIHRQFVSRLWEAGYLPAFYVSQFSDPEVGHLLGCRLLEADAGIPPHEQAAIQGGGMDPSFFISLGDSGETRQIKLLVWAVCHTRPDGKQWILLQFEDCSFQQRLFKDEDRPWYKDVWDHVAGTFNVFQGRGHNNPNIRYNQQVIESLNIRDLGEVYELAAAEHPDQIDQINTEVAVYRAIQSGLGTGGSSFMGSLMAFLSAAAMLFSFGTLAVGAGMAGLIMVIMLMCLPVTLIALAMNRTRHIGSKMLTYTFASFFVKTLFTLALSITLAITGRGQAEIMKIMGPGMERTVLLMILPVMVIYMLRRLAKTAGFGSLATINGALRATGSMEASLVGNARAGGYAGTANPFSRFNRTSGGRGAGREGSSGGLRGLANTASERLSREGRAHASHARDVRRRAVVNPETVRNRVTEARVRSEERAKDAAYKAEVQRRAFIEKHGAQAAAQMLFRDGARPMPRPAVSTNVREGGKAFNTHDPFHAVNALPSSLVARRVDINGNQETDEQWHRRVESYLNAMGFRDVDGNDTWSLAGSLTPKERQQVLAGDTSPLQKLATAKLSPQMIREAEGAAGIEDRFSTDAHGFYGDSLRERAAGAVAAGLSHVDPRRVTDAWHEKRTGGLRREEIIDRRTRQRAAEFIADVAPARGHAYEEAKARHQSQQEGVRQQVLERRQSQQEEVRQQVLERRRRLEEEPAGQETTDSNTKGR